MGRGLVRVTSPNLWAEEVDSTCVHLLLLTPFVLILKHGSQKLWYETIMWLGSACKYVYNIIIFMSTTLWSACYKVNTNSTLVEHKGPWNWKQCRPFDPETRCSLVPRLILGTKLGHPKLKWPSMFSCSMGIWGRNWARAGNVQISLITAFQSRDPSNATGPLQKVRLFPGLHPASCRLQYS